MKQLTCEMCGSTDLIKQDGVFVCQACGCKYSIEEAKKMMVEGTVEVTGTVRLDSAAQAENMQVLWQSAYECQNGELALSYANKILEINSMNARAWINKMLSFEYIGTFEDSKYNEVIEAGRNAVAFATEGKKQEIALEVYTHILERACTMIDLATKRISEIKKKGVAALDVVSIYDRSVNEAMLMVLSVPDEIIAEDSSLTSLAEKSEKEFQKEANVVIQWLKSTSWLGNKIFKGSIEVKQKLQNDFREKIMHIKSLGKVAECTTK